MSEHILYVVVRNLPDMTPGKAQAHSGHAASKFTCEYKDEEDFRDWAGHRGFGTQINLKAVGNEELSVAMWQAFCTNKYYHYGEVVDETYPFTCSSDFYFKLKDAGLLTSEGKYNNNGLYTATRNELTAWYFFVPADDEEMRAFIKKEFDLA